MNTHLIELHDQGYTIVDLPEAVAGVLPVFYSAVRQFFLRAQPYKDQFRTPSLQGYMTPYPGLHELYELKEANADEHLQVPPDLEETIWLLYHALHKIGSDVLVAISQQLVGDNSLLELLDDSTYRLLHYDRVRQAPPEVVEQFIPDHADSSILTVSPRSTAPALDIQAGGEWIEIEQQFTDNQVIVFGGECLARLTNNYYPAMVHRPNIKAMQQMSETRVSSPFFLRGRPEAVLDAGKLNADIIGVLDPRIAKSVTVADVSDNVDNCREDVPWKDAMTND